MRICRWCGQQLSLWRFWARFCRRCAIGRRCAITGQCAGIYLQGGGPPCSYMANLPKAGDS